MSRSLKQGVIAIAFVGLLALVAVRGSGGKLAEIWQWLGGSSATNAPAALDDAEALRRYGFRLTESAGRLGIDFRHEAATLDPHGTPADPCTRDEVVDKFTRLAAFSPVGDADAIVKLVDGIDASTRVGELSTLLRAARR